MKKLLSLLLLVSALAFSQAPPQGISHRGTVYNTSGVLTTDKDVRVRLSILNGTTAVYTEVQTVHTNNQGQYSLNIGTVNPTSFSAINWGSITAYLKVELDISTSPGVFPGTYLVSGTNQLMSVPYALYAQSSSNGFETINNITALRAYTSYTDNKIIYLKGYYNEGDGGEGFFIYKVNGKNTTAETVLEADNGGTIIKPDNSTNNGKWFRQYSGFLNVLYFGVVKDLNPPNIPSSFSNTDRIQKAIDYANKNYAYNKKSGSMTLYIPSGIYFIDKTLILKKGVKILGDKGTEFLNTIQTGYMFEIDKGPIVRLEMENITINLSSIQGVGGIHLKGVLDSGEGGIWDSKFKDIFIINAKGHGIYLEGSEVADNYLLPNQYIIFEGIHIVRTDANYNCLKMTGQQNTTTFLNCTFEIPFENMGAGSGLDGANINISSTGPDSNSCVITFLNCSTGGHVKYGARLINTQNITFDNCWFEDIDISVDIQNSKAINIKNSRFANAAGRGSRVGGSFIPAGTGRCITSDNSEVNVENNYVTVSDPNSTEIAGELFVTGTGSNAINLRNNSFQDIRLSESYGVLQYINIGNIQTYNSTSPASPTIAGINTLAKKVVLVTVPNNSTPTGTFPAATTNQIFRINSTIGVGETIFIRADQGTIQFNAWNPVAENMGRNIYLSGRTSLTLTNGQAATFIKLDGTNGNEKCSYQLVSISN